MYITVMDFSTSTVNVLHWNVESATDEEVEALLTRCGTHLTQVFYMTSDEEPDVGFVEVSDILSDEIVRELASPEPKIKERDLFSGDI